ncbi:MAG: NADH-quinone oxidoreductase subunit NuoE [Pseudomonadota bacterium]
MAAAAGKPITDEFGDFAFSPENEAKAKTIVARYPEGKQQSAVMPLLDLAQRQIGEATGTQGHLPVPVIEYVAAYLDMPYMRAYEVATFYTMYNLGQVGKFHVQLCGTTPCWLRGSDDVMRACQDRGMAHGKTTDDGLFTLTEVECLGACANAPMVQVNDDFYEDLTYESTLALLDALASGVTPKIGPQIDRMNSAPEGGATTLQTPIDDLIAEQKAARPSLEDREPETADAE